METSIKSNGSYSMNCVSCGETVHIPLEYGQADEVLCPNCSGGRGIFTLQKTYDMGCAKCGNTVHIPVSRGLADSVFCPDCSGGKGVYTVTVDYTQPAVHTGKCINCGAITRVDDKNHGARPRYMVCSSCNNGLGNVAIYENEKNQGRIVGRVSF